MFVSNNKFEFSNNSWDRDEEVDYETCERKIVIPDICDSDISEIQPNKELKKNEKAKLFDVKVQPIVKKCLLNTCVNKEKDQLPNFALNIQNDGQFNGKINDDCSFCFDCVNGGVKWQCKMSIPKDTSFSGWWAYGKENLLSFEGRFVPPEINILGFKNFTININSNNDYYLLDKTGLKLSYCNGKLNLEYLSNDDVWLPIIECKVPEEEVDGFVGTSQEELVKNLVSIVKKENANDKTLLLNGNKLLLLLSKYISNFIQFSYPKDHRHGRWAIKNKTSDSGIWSYFLDDAKKELKKLKEEEQKKQKEQAHERTQQRKEKIEEGNRKKKEEEKSLKELQKQPFEYNKITKREKKKRNKEVVGTGIGLTIGERIIAIEYKIERMKKDRHNKSFTTIKQIEKDLEEMNIANPKTDENIAKIEQELEEIKRIEQEKNENIAEIEKELEAIGEKMKKGINNSTKYRERFAKIETELQGIRADNIKNNSSSDVVLNSIKKRIDEIKTKRKETFLINNISDKGALLRKIDIDESMSKVVIKKGTTIAFPYASLSNKGNIEKGQDKIVLKDDTTFYDIKTNNVSLTSFDMDGLDNKNIDPLGFKNVTFYINNSDDYIIYEKNNEISNQSGTNKNVLKKEVSDVDVISLHYRDNYYTLRCCCGGKWYDLISNEDSCTEKQLDQLNKNLDFLTNSKCRIFADKQLRKSLFNFFDRFMPEWYTLKKTYYEKLKQYKQQTEHLMKLYGELSRKDGEKADILKKEVDVLHEEEKIIGEEVKTLNEMEAEAERKIKDDMAKEQEAKKQDDMAKEPEAKKQEEEKRIKIEEEKKKDGKGQLEDSKKEGTVIKKQHTNKITGASGNMKSKRAKMSQYSRNIKELHNKSNNNRLQKLGKKSLGFRKN